MAHLLRFSSGKLTNGLLKSGVQQLVIAVGGYRLKAAGNFVFALGAGVKAL